MPEDQTGKAIAQQHRPNHEHCYLYLVLHEVGQSLRAIADSQVADPEVADEPRDRDRRCKAVQRRLKDARGKHEEFERRRRWQKRGNQHSDKTVAFHPMTNRVRVIACFPVEDGLPAFSRDEVEQHAPQHRSRRRHQGVERHARRMHDG